MKWLAPHKVFSGNRPSSTFLYRKLDPAMLGRLVALYEHRVFTMAAIWDTNPFDQWGVELGKELASKLVPIMADNSAPTAGLDASTRCAVTRITSPGGASPIAARQEAAVLIFAPPRLISGAAFFPTP